MLTRSACFSGSVLALGLTCLAAISSASPTYESVAREVGVVFTHAGMSPAFSPYEQGGGVCFADLDGDGFEDLYFVNAPENRHGTAIRGPASATFRNLGDGTFENVTARSGLDYDGWGQSCSAVDYDNDGDLDVLTTGYGWSALHRNEGDFRFVNATAEAGLLFDDCGEVPCFAAGAGWVDLENDGCLDVYIVTYAAIPFGGSTMERQENRMYRNRCDGSFDDVTERTGLAGRQGSPVDYVPVWSDFDGDGDFDVYIAEDGVENELYRNEGDGTFTEIAAAAGVDDPRAGMGLDFQDATGDGYPDLYMTHYTGENNGFYENLRDGTFLDRSGEGDLDHDFPFLGWGTGFYDFDHDGDVDVYAVNGEIMVEDKNQSRLLFLQDDGVFVDASADAGPGFAEQTSARGSAVADFDLDGDLDVAINNAWGQSASFLRASGVEANFLYVEPRASLRDAPAIGAVVTVTPAGGAPVTRIVHAGSGFLSQNTAYQPFGLGAATTADLEIRWPDGTRDAWNGVAANQVVRARQGKATLDNDTLAPRTVLILEGEGKGGFYRSEVTVSLSSSDLGIPWKSGVVATEYRLAGGEWRPYEGPFTLRAEGSNEVWVRSRDAVGNREPPRLHFVLIDYTAPVSRLFEDGPRSGEWYLAAPTLAVAAQDAVSGVASVEWRIDGGDWTEATREGFSPGAIEGERWLAHRATDVVGHVETGQEAVIRIDLADPSLAIHVGEPSVTTREGTWVTSRTPLSALADDSGSGVASVEARVDEGTWLPAPGGVHLEGPDGRHRVEFRATDAAGRRTVAAVDVSLDNHRPPPLRVAYSASAILQPFGGQSAPVIAAGSVTLAAEAGPDVSGIASVRAFVDGIERAATRGPLLTWSWPASKEAPGSHVLRVEAEDGLGNVAAWEQGFIVVAKPSL